MFKRSLQHFRKINSSLSRRPDAERKGAAAHTSYTPRRGAARTEHCRRNAPFAIKFDVPYRQYVTLSIAFFNHGIINTFIIINIIKDNRLVKKCRNIFFGNRLFIYKNYPVRIL